MEKNVVQTLQKLSNELQDEKPARVIMYFCQYVALNVLDFPSDLENENCTILIIHNCNMYVLNATNQYFRD